MFCCALIKAQQLSEENKDVFFFFWFTREKVSSVGSRYQRVTSHMDHCMFEAGDSAFHTKTKFNLI